MALLTAYWGLDGIIIFTSIMVATYLYMTRKFRYWAKKGIMEVPPTPFIGNFSDCFFLRKSISQFTRDLYERSKGLPFMGFYIFDKPFFLVRDPELVKSVLLKDFNYFQDRFASADVDDRLGYANLFMMKNPAWKVLRSKLTPIFTSGKLKRMFELMTVIADDLETHLTSTTSKSGMKEVELKDLCANFTTDMIGSTAFGIRVNSLNDPNAPFRNCGRQIFDYDAFRAFEYLAIFFVPSMVRPTRTKFFGKKPTQFLRTVFWDVIKTRMESGEKRNDLIDLLIELKIKYEEEELEGFKFSGDDLVAQAAIFFIGGFETSSTTMSLTLYELALNKEIQNTLRKEIHEALEQTGGKVTYDMVMSLPYLDKVVSETLRKHPPLAFLDRVTTKDYKLPNSDVVLEKGTPVYIPMLGLHYDPEYYPEPEKYDPERFSEENKAKRPYCTYLPFGDGPHACIGLRLGLLQSKLGVLQVIKKYEVTPCEKTSIPLKIDPKGLSTTVLGGVYINIRKITSEAG